MKSNEVQGHQSALTQATGGEPEMDKTRDSLLKAPEKPRARKKPAANPGVARSSPVGDKERKKEKESESVWLRLAKAHGWYLRLHGRAGSWLHEENIMGRVL